MTKTAIIVFAPLNNAMVFFNENKRVEKHLSNIKKVIYLFYHFNITIKVEFFSC